MRSFCLFFNYYLYILGGNICLLQVHHRVMPSHTVYALNMERILSRLWHPSHEELEQDHVHRQRLAAKDGVLIS